MRSRYFLRPALAFVLTLGSGLLLLTRPVVGQSAPAITYRRASLGFDAGWGAPTGWGLTYSHLIGERTDWTFGAGLGISGAKVGVGLRWYVAPTRRVSPWFGTALALSGGMSDLSVSADGGGDDDLDWFSSSRTSAERYSIRSGWTVHVRSGLRWQPGRVGFLGSLGYSQRLGRDPFRFPDTMIAADRRLARALGPGGVEVALGIVVGLGQ